MSSRCGTCVMCCKTMAVPELAKPAHTWCKHCAIGEGCKIYEDRPQSCRTFECMWYYSKDWPDEMRPDHCKVVFKAISKRTVLAVVEHGRSTAWKEPPVTDQIKRFVVDGVTVAVSAKGYPSFAIYPPGRLGKEVWQELMDRAKEIE